MNYDIKLSKLNSDLSSLSEIKENFKDLYNEFESSYINSLTSSELSGKCNMVKNSVKRLQTGVNNLYSWLSDYKNDLVSLEQEISASATAVSIINGFDNIFGKYVIPTLKTGATGDDRIAKLKQDAPFKDLIPNNNSNNKVPYYAQGDSQWGNIPYGPETIATGGCAIASAAMAASYVKNELITPKDINEDIDIQPYYVWPDVGSDHAVFYKIAETYGINCEDISSASVTTALKNGNPVIMSTGSQPFTSGGHLICLTGVTPEGKITLNDPNGSHAEYSYDEWDVDYVLDRGTAFYEYSVED